MVIVMTTLFTVRMILYCSSIAYENEMHSLTTCFSLVDPQHFNSKIAAIVLLIENLFDYMSVMKRLSHLCQITG